MSSHDSKEAVDRVGPSTTKRISTLNEHEDHILRRKINAYQKIHKKEIAEVSSKLDEIRESMKALATDPLYGTHALHNAGPSEDILATKTPVSKEEKSKLRRTQSFPDLSDGLNAAGSSNTSSFPALKREYHVRSAGKSGERTTPNHDVLKSRTKSIGSPHSHDSAQTGRETIDWQEIGHKKLERSKTAPVTMLQPLLITTPEMMRKKIHISTSNRRNNDDITGRRGLSPRVVEISSKISPKQSQSDSGSLLHRPKSTSDAQSSPPRGYSQDNKRQFKFPGRKLFNKAEPNDDSHAFFRGKNVYGQKSSNRGITKHVQKSQEDIFEVNDLKENEQSIEELKYCRYLRFSKENQESNRI